MAAIFELGSNYDYIYSVLKRRLIVTDKELLECIKSQCDPEKIMYGAIENGFHIVGMLGLIIEEAGKRKIYNAAPFIVEFLAWPYYDDLWVHLVPKCLNALCAIGDDSIMDRLIEITSADIFVDKMVELISAIDQPNNNFNIGEKLNLNPFEDLKARIIMIAIDEQLITKGQIQHWADNIIMEENDALPDWVFDLSLFGNFDFRDAPEGPPFKSQYNERLLYIILFYKAAQINILFALGKIMVDSVEKEILLFVLECHTFAYSPVVKHILSQIEDSFNVIMKRNPVFMKVINELLFLS